jgi:hypothetical protein
MTGQIKFDRTFDSPMGKVKMHVSVSEQRRKDRFDPQYYEAHVHVWPKGESVLDNLMNRRNRPYTDWKKFLIPVMAEGLKKAGFEVTDPHWNQRLGCSCPCSPGFKMRLQDIPTKQLAMDHRSFGFVIHIDYTIL